MSRFGFEGEMELELVAEVHEEAKEAELGSKLGSGLGYRGQNGSSIETAGADTDTDAACEGWSCP